MEKRPCEIRIKGSHHFLRHADGRGTVVPVHRGETIGRGLLAQILRDCDISREEVTTNHRDTKPQSSTEDFWASS